MKKYILTITYNFDADYIIKSFDTEAAAIKTLNKYLKDEIETVKDECEYEPSVIRWDDLGTNITLVYAYGYTDDPLEVASRIYAREDCAEYRVFEVEV